MAMTIMMDDTEDEDEDENEIGFGEFLQISDMISHCRSLMSYVKKYS
jgi:hypothetical protein